MNDSLSRLQGLSARGEGGLKLQKHFRHGSFAEQMSIPTENAIPLGSVNEADVARWCAVSMLLVPFLNLSIRVGLYGVPGTIQVVNHKEVGLKLAYLTDKRKISADIPRAKLNSVA